MADAVFAGSWRIVWMSDWDQDYVDMEVPGHITFDKGSTGSFQFGLVQGQMDCRVDKQRERRIEFTWHGFDEGDEMTDRGHAEIKNGDLQGQPQGIRPRATALAGAPCNAWCLDGASDRGGPVVVSG